MEKQRVSKLSEWAKDKPYALVMIAPQLAIGVEG